MSVPGKSGSRASLKGSVPEVFDAARHLAVFVDVCRLGSFSAVARLRSVTHSSVVRRIDALEADFGIRLLIRSTRALVPTSAGQLVLQRAQSILDGLADLRAEAAAIDGTVRGVLRIATLPTFGKRYVVPALRQLMSEHPELQVELDLTERIADPVTERLDVVIRVGQMVDTTLIATKLAPHERRLVASPSYLAQFGCPRSVADLAGHRLLDKMRRVDVLGWSNLLGSNTRTFAGGRDVFRCDDFEALRAAALSGFGIALLPSWVVGQDITAGALTRLLPDLVDQSGDAGAIYLLRAHLDAPAKVTAFIASLRNVIGAPPVWNRTESIGTPLGPDAVDLCG